MAILQWGNASIKIGEMNRDSALRCSAELYAMAGALANSEDRITEEFISTLIAVNAPAVAIVGGKTIRAGDVSIAVDDETYTITLPLTVNTFGQLPFSASTLWAEAACNANGHLMDELKKALSRDLQRLSELQPGSAPSSNPTPVTKEIPTTGE